MPTILEETAKRLGITRREIFLKALEGLRPEKVYYLWSEYYQNPITDNIPKQVMAYCSSVVSQEV